VPKTAGVALPLLPVFVEPQLDIIKVNDITIPIRILLHIYGIALPQKKPPV
jgi:hypothetical protein